MVRILGLRSYSFIFRVFQFLAFKESCVDASLFLSFSTYLSFSNIFEILLCSFILQWLASLLFTWSIIDLCRVLSFCFCSLACPVMMYVNTQIHSFRVSGWGGDGLCGRMTCRYREMVQILGLGCYNFLFRVYQSLAFKESCVHASLFLSFSTYFSPPYSICNYLNLQEFEGKSFESLSICTFKLVVFKHLL